MIDSMRNKGVKIPAADVNGIQDVVNTEYDAIATTTYEPDPGDTGVQRYLVAEYGTFVNLLDENEVPIEVTGVEFESGLVEIFGEGGVFRKKVTILPITSYVAKSQLVKRGDNLFNSSYLKTNTRINSAGTEQVSAGARMCSKVPVTAGSTYRVEGWVEAVSKNGFFYNAGGVAIGALININAAYPAADNVVAPANAAFFSVNIMATGAEADATSTLSVREVLPTGKAVTGIMDYKLLAAGLDADNYTPTPTTGTNAASKGYVDGYAVAKASITSVSEIGANLFNPALIITGKLIDSTGALFTATGWNVIKIPVPDGATSITFGRINSVRASLYGRFADITDTLIGTLINFVPNGSAVTRAVPAGAKYIYIDLKGPTDPDATGYAQGTCNTGNALLTPYEPYTVTDYVTQIDGKHIKATEGGSADYDQSLNTTDNVAFNSLAVNSLALSALSIDLPLWDGTGSPPAGLLVNDAYTTPDGFIKRRTV